MVFPGEPAQHAPPGAEVLGDIPSNVLDPSGQPYQLEAWLFLPTTSRSSKLPPLIIMSHGYQARKDYGLSEPAARFAAEGYAALTLDYLGFGGSGGLPRELVDRRQQANDVKSVVDYSIQRLGARVDATRIVLWGTCFGSGPMVVAARELEQVLPNIAGVILQTPFLSMPIYPSDVLAKCRMSTICWWPLWFLGRYLSDLCTGGRNMRFLDMEYDYGTPQQGFCLAPSCLVGLHIVPPQTLDNWKEKPLSVHARSMWRLLKLFCCKWSFQAMRAPVLAIAAKNEQITGLRFDDLQRWAKGKTHIQVEEVPGEHFSVYPKVNPEVFERMKKYMTTPETTYNEDAYPETMRIQCSWLQNQLGSRL